MWSRVGGRRAVSRGTWEHCEGWDGAVRRAEHALVRTVIAQAEPSPQPRYSLQVSGGNGEQVISRDVHRLCTHFDFFRLLSFYHSGACAALS